MPSDTYITVEEMRLMINRLIGGDRGSQRAFAQKCGTTQQQISNIVRGTRNPGKKLASLLGFERVVMYRKKAESSDKKRRNG